jgi:hypothetical protein
MAFRVVQHRRARLPWRRRLRKSKSHQFRDSFRKYSGQARGGFATGPGSTRSRHC